MKNILLISYHFPPSAAVGGIRIAHFSKSLPRFEWNPIVLTLKDQYIEHIDPVRLREIEDIPIIKAGTNWKLSHLYTMLKKQFSGAVEDQGGNAGGSYWNNSHRLSNTETLAKKIKRYSLAFLSLPDPERNWVLPATWKTIREIRKRDIHYIITSCPPYSVHLIGLLAKIFLNIKWVADYRDPWTINDTKQCFQTCALSMAIERRMEEQVIRHADMVLANTRNLQEAFENRYIDEKDGKFVYLPNMIDTKSYEGFRRMGKYPEFTISYTGSLYLGRTPEPLFAAIQELLREGKIREGDIRVKLVGNCDQVNGAPISDIIERYGLCSAVEVSGLVPHAKSLEIIRRSHLGLLLAPEQPLQIPAKVYEYMGLGTTVLAIVKDGATKDLLHAVGAGRAFYPDDIQAIKDFMLETMTREEDSQDDRDGKIFDAFEVSNVVRRLAAELDRLCDGTA